MKKTPIAAFLLVAFSIAVSAQIPQQYIWKITFVAESVGNSKISVQNRCRDSHDFSISGSNVPFLEFAKDKVNVPGASSESVPVSVNTKGLTRRSYQGQVTLFCLTCDKDNSCSQSRDILNVTLNVVSKDQLANYRPSKEIGIDSPIAISATASVANSASGGTSEAEVRKLLEDLSDSPSANYRPGTNAVSACGIPQMRPESQLDGKDCNGECEKKQKAARELEAKVRAQTIAAERYCLGLMQLENTTAFVEARARRAESQLVRASERETDERVMNSLRSEAENSRKDAKVFRDKVTSARGIVDKAKEEAFAVMQELDDAISDYENCRRKNGKNCD